MKIMNGNELLNEWDECKYVLNSHDNFLKQKWINYDDLIEYLNEKSNPCVDCGSVQCAVCSTKILKELKFEEK